MDKIAILIGTYSYLIFSLGLSAKLESKYIFGVTLLFFGLIILVHLKSILKDIKNFLIFLRDSFKDKMSALFLFLIFCSALINLIGALGPELGFDALWYHLTLPKIYLQNKKILYIPGNLLYYSAMPKLVEMLYTAALALKDEIFAKLIHFFFGILCSISLYRFSRRYLNPQTSLFATVIFYTSLIVGWQSITAYVDLGRTFFEILALDYFSRWWEKQRNEDLIDLGIMLGLAISSKLLSFGSFLIYLILILFKIRKEPKKYLFLVLCFLFLSILIPFPWFTFSYIHTKNPFFPIFSNILDDSHRIVFPNLLKFLKDFWGLFMYCQDPISPIILIILPLIFLTYKKFNSSKKMIVGYCFLAYTLWYFIPRVGGGRFFLPYLPAFSLFCGLIFDYLNSKIIKKYILFLTIFLSFFNIGYRFIANKKYLPVILEKETKKDFLIKNLNFQFGDFFDVDGFFKKNILKHDLVLIYGIHNLFYVDFPFVHESWAKPGIPITHILVQNGELPKIFGQKRVIYENLRTGVNLYPYGNRLPDNF